ncbi:MAG TPA: hypothetical protein VG146_05235 [Verrucomicrobiae bacterium]|nr:hypothetical protein [Verrucomicrobiae bacterium]
MKTSIFRCLALGVLAFAVSLRADVIYDNSKSDLETRFDPGMIEVGDEILLSGSARFLTNFSFEFWGTARNGSFAAPVEARVRFYQNDGALVSGYHAPGTLFYDSDWVSIGQPTSRNTLVFDLSQDPNGGGIFLPVVSDMTWSVQFQGFGAGDAAGVDLYSPPASGQAYPDYWELSGNVWELKTNTMPMNFAARFEASPVPEPGTFAWVALGGLVLLARSRIVVGYLKSSV